MSTSLRHGSGDHTGDRVAPRPRPLPPPQQPQQHHAQHHHHTPSEVAARELGLPWAVAQPTLVAYRSAGIGLFGALMRFAGMPLEKLALYMNSSQVSGRGQFRQALALTFAEGPLAPYRVVGPSSLTAWFLQYSVMVRPGRRCLGRPLACHWPWRVASRSGRLT